MDNNTMKNLENTFKIYSEDDMNHICASLKLLKIHHFHFMKFFDDGDCLSISNNRKWLEHFYSAKLFQYSHFTQFKKYRNGETLWQDMNELKVILENRASFGLSNNGMTMVINNKSSCNAYHFATPSLVQSHLLFLHHIDLLYRFIFFFQEKPTLLLRNQKNIR
jgi:hypothetical protein